MLNEDDEQEQPLAAGFEFYFRHNYTFSSGRLLSSLVLFPMAAFAINISSHTQKRGRVDKKKTDLEINHDPSFHP
jgi:hypothetical protein